ncbi:hypothetical protein LEP1GSC051_3622 [Leptospira sp. P2653]|nr:hypothetical protein LEP1GSC051_3622 [Leptospira sp. P2653]
MGYFHDKHTGVILDLRIWIFLETFKIIEWCNCKFGIL